MTRLTTHDIAKLDSELTQYNLSLIEKTGVDLAAIASFAAGITRENLKQAIQKHRAAVVPITSGQGIIGGFAESVQSIIQFLGCACFVTEAANVAGIAEAIDRKASIIFAADDDRFIAYHVGKGSYVDNGEATGRGYVAALAHMAKGLKGQDVLVLGAGPVGQGAISLLKELGARVKLFDLQAEALKPYQTDALVTLEFSLSEALSKYRFILDATPAGGFIGADDLQPLAMLAAPGIPLGLNLEALAKFGPHLIHDPLQIGVATMLAMIL